MSVSCRKVQDEDDSEQTEIRKQSTSEFPQDRVAYYKRLQGQVKLGAQDLTFTNRQVGELLLFLDYCFFFCLLMINKLFLTNILLSSLCEYHLEYT